MKFILNYLQHNLILFYVGSLVLIKYDESVFFKC